MADAKPEKKDDKKPDAASTPSVSSIAVIKGIFVLIVLGIGIFFIVYFTYLNQTSTKYLLYFLYNLEFFFAFSILFFLWRFYELTFEFQFWNDKVGEFYSKKYKPDKITIEARPDVILRKFAEIKDIFTDHDESLWAAAFKEMFSIFLNEMRQKTKEQHSIEQLVAMFLKSDFKNKKDLLLAIKIRETVQESFSKEKVSKNVLLQALSLYENLSVQIHNFKF